MKTSIVLLADLHFPILTPQKLNPYKYVPTIENNFHVNRLLSLADEINQLTPDAVYLIGDFVDKTTMNLCTEKILKQFIKTINCEVYYLNGNHERFNQQDYLLDYLETDMQPLPTTFKLHDTTFTAIHHGEIHQITEHSSDILLSHFRWSLPTHWGRKGELSTTTLKTLTKNFNDLILGDIHAEYQPEDNVTYINQPYSNKYTPLSPKGFILLGITDEGYEITRVHTHLPNKILLSCNFEDLNELLNSCSKVDLYKIRVHLTLEQVELLPTIDKNIKLEYLFENKETTTQIVIKQDTVLDTLLSVLPEDNKTYIQEVLSD